MPSDDGQLGGEVGEHDVGPVSCDVQRVALPVYPTTLMRLMPDNIDASGLDLPVLRLPQPSSARP
ncbi:hypothetical protein ACFQ51_34720 [Streptomyces kaempferi]